MKPLTGQQRECLSIIIRSYERRAKAPLIGEIAQRMGMTNNGVQYHLRALEEQGYIRRSGATYGYIKLVKDLDGDHVTVEVDVRIRKVTA